jgi:hypothetical protein
MDGQIDPPTGVVALLASLLVAALLGAGFYLAHRTPGEGDTEEGR